MTATTGPVGLEAGAGLDEEPSDPVGRFLLNLRSGNLGIVPIVVAQLFIVVFFSLTATNFFTAVNFGNIIIQMAGTTMLVFGVVFVLLIGEIDLSIGYVAGIGGLIVAELQIPGSSQQMSGLIAIPIAIAACALIGAAQGSIVAYVGVPSFVVTLAGFLIWQGVILRQLEAPGSIIIQDKWINDTANYYFSPLDGWVIAAVITGLYVLSMVANAAGRHAILTDRLKSAAKVAGVAVATFGTVAISNHAVIEGTHQLGLPLSAVEMVVILVALTFLAKRTTFGRHVYAVGGNAEAARRAGINVPRIRVLVFAISGATAAMGGIIGVGFLNSVDLTYPPSTLLLNSIAAAVIGGVSLFGGRGEVRGGLLGALVIATVGNGLDTAGYSPATIYIVTGLILLLAVTLDTFARRLQVPLGPLAAMPIPTEPIGSIPRPLALIDGVQAAAEGRIGPAELDALYDDAVRETIAALEATGSPVVSDGEQRKPSFVTYPVHGYDGLAPDGVLIPFADGHTRQLPRLTRGPFRYQTYSEQYVAKAQRVATRPLKQAVISASALSLLYPQDGIDGYPREAFISDLVGEAEKDIRGALERGVHCVQIDFTEARLSLKLDPSGGLLRDFVTLNNQVLGRFSESERARIGVHSCPGGDQDSTHSAEVDYAELLPTLFELDAGSFYVELAGEPDPGAVLGVIAANLPAGRRIFIGVTDPIDPAVESAEQVRDRVLAAAELIPAGQLGTTDDCGFSPFGDDTSTARETAFAKIRARVEGTALAADELGL